MTISSEQAIGIIAVLKSVSFVVQFFGLLMVVAAIVLLLPFASAKKVARTMEVWSAKFFILFAAFNCVMILTMLMFRWVSAAITLVVTWLILLIFIFYKRPHFDDRVVRIARRVLYGGIIVSISVLLLDRIFAHPYSPMVVWQAGFLSERLSSVIRDALVAMIALVSFCHLASIITTPRHYEDMSVFWRMIHAGKNIVSIVATGAIFLMFLHVLHRVL